MTTRTVTTTHRDEAGNSVTIESVQGSWEPPDGTPLREDVTGILPDSGTVPLQGSWVPVPPGTVPWVSDYAKGAPTPPVALGHERLFVVLAGDGRTVIVRAYDEITARSLARAHADSPVTVLPEAGPPGVLFEHVDYGPDDGLGDD